MLVGQGFSRADVMAMSEAEMESMLQTLVPPVDTSSDSGGRKATRVKSLRKPKPAVTHAKP